eukprot:303339_1
MAGATLQIFDDNIFNLLKDDRHSLQHLTASAVTLQKLKTRSLNTFSDDQKLQASSTRSPHMNTRNDRYQMLRKKRISQINLDYNRFSIISRAVYEALHRKQKMTDIVLEKHELVHFVGSIFSFSFLYGGQSVDTRRVETWMSNAQHIPAVNTPGRILLHQLLTNNSGDSQLRLEMGGKPTKT